MKKCTKCNKIKELNEFGRGRNNKDGYRTWCNECMRLYTKEYRTKGGVIVAERTRISTQKYKQTDIGKYNTLKSQSKKRGLKVKITLGFFSKLIKEPCYYCGKPNKTKGLDRIRNELGYLITNVVSCCNTCNWMKNTHTVGEFIEHCRAIVANIQPVDKPTVDSD